MKLLPRDTAEDLFFSISPREQVELILALPQAEQRSWVRGLAPDDAADLIQEAPTDLRDRLLGMLDDQTRREVTALLAYREDLSSARLPALLRTARAALRAAN